MTHDLERLWSDLLSEDAALVLPALLGLPQGERQAALAHLHAMAHGPGWNEAQARRASSALAIADGDPRVMGTRPED